MWPTAPPARWRNGHYRIDGGPAGLTIWRGFQGPRHRLFLTRVCSAHVDQFVRFCCLITG
jgi:hypothetical protein